jgi:crossover junction endodeoxyribonuclease RusA
MQGDIDNIVKPILDAMCGIAYVDDQCVAGVTVRKIEPGQPVQVTNPGPILTNALTSAKPLVYVRISDDPYGEPL